MEDDQMDEKQIKTISRTDRNEYNIVTTDGAKIKITRRITERWTVGVDIVINGMTIQGNCDATDADIKLWSELNDIHYRLSHPSSNDRSDALLIMDEILFHNS